MQFLHRLFIQVFCATLLSVGGLKAQVSNKVPTIAITQLTAHPSLDQVYAGILAGLKCHGYEHPRTAKILFSNAHGDLPLTATIARQFLAQKPDVVVGITTPSAQALYQAFKGTGIPVVFSSITDPVAAGLVKNLAKPDQFATGVRNVTPLEDQIVFMQSLLPNLKTLGVVINPAETNSVDLLKRLKRVAQQYGITILEAGAENSAGVGIAANSLVKRIDAFFLLQDNTVASALQSLLRIAQGSKVPVVATYLEAVEQGALMGLAYSEFVIGEQTAHMVARILAGVPPANLPVETAQDLQTAVNRKTAENLGIELPPQFIENIDVIYN